NDSKCVVSHACSVAFRLLWPKASIFCRSPLPCVRNGPTPPPDASVTRSTGSSVFNALIATCPGHLLGRQVSAPLHLGPRTGECNEEDANNLVHCAPDPSPFLE